MTDRPETDPFTGAFRAAFEPEARRVIADEVNRRVTKIPTRLYLVLAMVCVIALGVLAVLR